MYLCDMYCLNALTLNCMLYYPSIDKAHFHVDLDIHCPGLRIGVVNGSHIQLFGNDLKHLNFDHSMSTNSEI